ncbi:MAG: hypothetical protein AB1489_01265 [Acidobacteriota bacterium]
MPETKQELEEEVARLRAKVQELEKELETEQEKQKSRSKTSESSKNISKRATDEGTSLIRAFTLAGVEFVRSTGSVLETFADTVSKRNQPKEKSSTSDLTRDLPKDVYSGGLDAIEQFFDIPGKVIEKLHESYKETKET